MIEDFSAQLLEDLPDDVLKSRSVIVGNSIGCSIALHLADRFDAAFLVAPFTKMYSYTLPRSEGNISGLLTSLVHDPSRLRENEVAKHVERYRALLDSKGRRHHLQKLRKIKAAAEGFTGEHRAQEALVVVARVHQQAVGVLVAGLDVGHDRGRAVVALEGDGVGEGLEG